MIKIKRLIIALITIVMMMQCSLASSLDNTSANTTTSGWSYSTQSGHMGTKNSTYTFSSNAVGTRIAGYVTDGKNLWGSNINFNYMYNSSNTFSLSPAHSDATAYTAVNSVNSEGHRTSFSIVLYEELLGSNTHRTVAHEIGHAYGLGHVSTTANIMYGGSSSTKNVTSQDIWGMKIVTHAHVHSTSTTGTYSVYSNIYHYVVCSSCKGKYKQAHSYDSTGMHCTKCSY